MAFSQYRHTGGEERSMLTEADLLRAAGHTVEVASISSWTSAAGEIRSALQAFAPDIVHVQNFFPLLRPRHYRIIRAAGCPIVQSLRNYRLSCMSANHWRDDAPCVECSFGDHSAGVVHGCYRGSRPQSLVAAGLLRSHRDSWTTHISAYVAVSDHVRDTVRASVGDTPIFVKPNTVVTQVRGDGSAANVVYVGRLSAEKGIVDLAGTWAADPSLPDLVVLGDGPQRGEIERLADASPNIRFEGQTSHDHALRRMGEALATVAPWRWDEPFGRALMESLAVGTPVIAAPTAASRFPDDTGAIVTYHPSDSNSIAVAISAIAGDLTGRRAAARAYFERSFSPVVVLDTLVDVYGRVLDAADRSGPTDG